jgi:hypothetical protein
VVGDGAVIRDVTIIYENVTVSPNGAARFGGIAGTAQGNAQFINVLVKGAATFNVRGSTDAYVGGLIGLMQGTSGVKNAYGGLNLTVNKTNTDPTCHIYVGGIAGSMGRPANGDAVSVQEASAVGNITVGSSGYPVDCYHPKDNYPNGLCVGGLVGCIRGASSSSRAILNDANYRQGNIIVWSGKGSSKTGGAVGLIYDHAETTDCSSIAGKIEVDKSAGDNLFYLGGFVGNIGDVDKNIVSVTDGKVERCYSENHISVIAGPNFEGWVITGGFVGCIRCTTIRYCYAKGNVSAFNYENVINAGGFAGSMDIESSASSCYAAGNVTAWSKSNKYINVGGFAGLAMTLTDCYALGNVFGEMDGSNAGPISAGGIGGELSSAVNRCFAAGSVIAQMSQNTWKLFAGGLLGHISSTGTMSNSAALGQSITLTGPCPQNIGRVYGYSDSTTATVNNHAYNDMKFYQSNTYGAGGITPTTPSSNDPASANGKDANLGMFRDLTFWQTTLGFSSAVWDFATVVSKGYPRLKNADGSIMGGQ